jgi:cob(I)alamin adenosyltransferase
LYTRKGDDGSTGLLGEGRVAKSDARMEALGSLDEASAALGLARSLMKPGHAVDLVIEVQRDLYHLMAEVAATEQNRERFRKIDADRVKWLEEQIDEIGRKAQIPEQFILPGGNPAAAAISLARAIVRRAERRVVKLFNEGAFTNEYGLAYLNRLSSLCFALEIHEIEAGGNGTPLLARGE